MSRSSPALSVINATKGEVLARRLSRAGSFGERLLGYMFRRRPDDGEGLLLENCSSIHMFFMRFSIDAVFIDSSMRVTKVSRSLLPFLGFAWSSNARSVIELPSGGADGVEPGDELRVIGPEPG